MYRDAKGFPEWKAAGLPIESIPADQARSTSEPESAGPLDGWAMLWTLLGVFVGWTGSQPDSVCLSVDSYNRLILRRQVRSGSRKTGSSRFDCTSVDLSVTNSVLGRSGGSYGKPDGIGASEPHRVGGCRRCSGFLCHKPLRILGAATSPESYQRGIQVLRRILRHAVHGLDSRCRGSPVSGTFRTGFTYLGGEHGQPLVGFPHLLHTQPRVWAYPLFFWRCFQGAWKSYPDLARGCCG